MATAIVPPHIALRAPAPGFSAHGRRPAGAVALQALGGWGVGGIRASAAQGCGWFEVAARGQVAMEHGKFGTYLPNLTAAFKGLDKDANISTKEFAEAVEAILPIFDHLGTVFHFAKTEMNHKRESLVKVQDKLITLNDVVEADMKAGTVTTKNSCARNLYRLLSGVMFISSLLHRLGQSATLPLRQAATETYQETMSAMHTYFVRMAVRTSMYLLPDRESFLHSIGETEETAKGHAAEFCPAVNKLVKKVMQLYEGTTMPVSDTAWMGAS